MGNVERWFLKLRFADHQVAILERFGALMNTIHAVLGKAKAKAGALLPSNLAQRIDGLRNGVTQLKAKGNEMIPEAIKELDQYLREVQAYVRSGGEATSRKTLHEVATGERIVTRADEARLVEGGPLPARSARGGWKQNQAPANRPDLFQKYYRHAPEYPDLTQRVDRKGNLEAVAAYSGRLINRELKPGEEVFRFFGPAGTTHGQAVSRSYAGGRWWGLGPAPKTAKEWREKAAVLDEFNRDGFFVVGRVGDAVGPKAVVGTVAEQAGERIPGQYLPGGATQAYFLLGEETATQLGKIGETVMASGRAEPWVDSATGITFQILPTGWKDSNGVWGYAHVPAWDVLVQTSRVGTREQATKDSREVIITP
ncbi:hypothetical protein [Cupriavidus necator]|uniref:hypothetical protein n=1 Tax=Cupriavidus necator TaxID=106590 RepID=UPI00339DA339